MGACQTVGHQVVEMGKKPVGKGNKMVRKLNHRIEAKIISNDFFTHFKMRNHQAQA